MSMTPKSDDTATRWHHCDRQLDELDNYCPACGEKRPAPSTSEDERIADALDTCEILREQAAEIARLRAEAAAQPETKGGE